MEGFSFLLTLPIAIAILGFMVKTVVGILQGPPGSQSRRHKSPPLSTRPLLRPTKERHPVRQFEGGSFDKWVACHGSDAPILYLRSFAGSGPSARQATIEKRLLKAFGEVGPVIAVGEPGKTPQADIPRIFLDDTMWQDQVTFLMQRSLAVVISVDASHGVAWELGQALRTMSPERLILVLPDSHDTWSSFVQAATSHFSFPYPMPTETGTHEVMHFDAMWRPQLLASQSLAPGSYGTWRTTERDLNRLTQHLPASDDMPPEAVLREYVTLTGRVAWWNPGGAGMVVAESGDMYEVDPVHAGDDWHNLSVDRAVTFDVPRAAGDDRARNVRPAESPETLTDDVWEQWRLKGME